MVFIYGVMSNISTLLLSTSSAFVFPERQLTQDTEGVLTEDDVANVEGDLGAMFTEDFQRRATLAVCQGRVNACVNTPTHVCTSHKHTCNVHNTPTDIHVCTYRIIHM